MATTTIKERPIIFSAEMVRAILDGRKTQTRRVVKPQPVDGDAIVEKGYGGWMVGRLRDSENAWRDVTCPYQKGMMLWVKETFDILSFGAGVAQICYRADGKIKIVDDHKLPNRQGGVSSQRMPRFSSRLTLEVTDVRVERVSEIGDVDAKAEGVSLMTDGQRTGDNYRNEFHHLWDSINKSRGYSWASNPWVWVVSFKPAEDEA